MKTDEKKEKIIGIAVCCIITGLFLTNISYGIFQDNLLLYQLVNLGCKAIILGCLLVSCIFIMKRINIKIILYIAIFILTILIQLVFFQNLNDYFIDNLINYATVILPTVVCFLSIKDYEKILKYLIKTSFFIATFTAIAFIVFGNNLFKDGYSMGFANIMIFPTNTLIYYLFNTKISKTKKVFTTILVLFNIFTIFAFGSRGALIDIVAFFIFSFIVNKKKTVGKYITIIATVIVMLVCITFYDDIIKYLISVFDDLGINSRTLTILSTDLNHDSGRTEIWESILAKISENPFEIRGINAEYMLVGIYSHNMFLELIYDLGIFIGTVITIYIIYAIIRTLLAKPSSYVHILQLLLFSFFPLLLWSDSIWRSIFFWVWICYFDSKKIYNKREELI